MRDASGEKKSTYTSSRIYAVARYVCPSPPTSMEDESVTTKQLFSAASLRAYWENMVRQLDAIAGKNGLQDPMAAQLRDEYEASLRRISDPVFVSKSLSNSQLMGGLVAESWPSAEEILEDRKAFMVHFDNMRHSGGLRTLHILDVTIEDCLFW